MAAVDLWDWAVSGLTVLRDRVAERSMSQKEKEQLAKQLPKPIAFPVYLDEFLRLMMPKKRKREQLALFRGWSAEDMRIEKWANLSQVVEIPYDTTPEATPAEILARLARYSHGLSRDQYLDVAQKFLKWLSDRQKRMFSNRGRLGAVARKKSEQSS